MRLATLLFFACITFTTYAQEQEASSILSDQMVMYLKTDDGDIKLDSADFGEISPEWIKEITIVSPPFDPEQPDFNPTPSMYIELKKRFEKKFFKSRE